MCKLRYTFVRAQRLLVTQQFQAVLKSVRRFKGRLLQLQALNVNMPHARLGIVIGKKQLSRANRRNTTKRHIREYFRLHQHDFLPLDYVVRVNQRFLPEELADVMRELERLFQQVKRCNKS
jgi:ribonuclease P protein component